MAIDKEIPQVSFKQAEAAILAGLEANIGTMLIGDPGVGKSALMRQVAKRLGTQLAVVIGSTMDPTDLGGMPVVRVDGKGIDRIPLELIRRLCEQPGLLFLDELACAPPAVQAAMLRGILERCFGDCELHPDTRVVAATNPPEQSPGGSELSAPLMGRLAVFHLRPTHQEVQDFFDDLEDAALPGLRDEALEFAATLRVQSDLLQIDIPDTAVTGNKPWGAPRAWERALRARAALGNGDKVVRQMVTASNVGQTQALAYEAIMDLRKFLPTIDECLKDPENVKVPDDKRRQIGAVGLIARVSERDKWAAMIVADRLCAELRAASGKMLMKRSGSTEDGHADSPHRKKGALARLNILKSLPKQAAQR
jgi:MoxR-like ATPase